MQNMVSDGAAAHACPSAAESELFFDLSGWHPTEGEFTADPGASDAALLYAQFQLAADSHSCGAQANKRRRANATRLGPEPSPRSPPNIRFEDPTLKSEMWRCRNRAVRRRTSMW